MRLEKAADNFETTIGELRMSLHWTSFHCDSAEPYLALCGRISIA